MDYDTEKADEMALALLYLTSFSATASRPIRQRLSGGQERHGTVRAWKGLE